MVKRGRGKIIFTASVLSFQGGVNVPGYVATKHAIAGVTKALANEWAPHGVNVNAIAPGYIQTDNTQALQRRSRRYAAIRRAHPRRALGQPEDLEGRDRLPRLERRPTTSTGRCIPVDGGWLGYDDRNRLQYSRR